MWNAGLLVGVKDCDLLGHGRVEHDVEQSIQTTGWKSCTFVERFLDSPPHFDFILKTKYIFYVEYISIVFPIKKKPEIMICIFINDLYCIL